MVFLLELDDNETFANCKTIIGYSFNPHVPIIFLLFSIIGLILNLLLIIDFIRKKNGNSSRKQSSMKKLFVVLPILDSIASLYWILSSAVFWEAERINNNIELCSFLSILYLSVFTFEFIFINFILIHLKKSSVKVCFGYLFSNNYH